MFQNVMDSKKIDLINEINLIFVITVIALIISILFVKINKNKIQFYI